MVEIPSFSLLFCEAIFTHTSLIWFQEELDRQLLNVGPSAADALPDVPAAEPARAVPAAKAKPVAVAEDDDLAELAAWAS